MSLENAIARIQKAAEIAHFYEGDRAVSKKFQELWKARAEAVEDILRILRDEGCIPEPKPRYVADEDIYYSGYFDRYRVSDDGELIAYCASMQAAQDYADYLNNKENQDNA